MGRYLDTRQTNPSGLTEFNFTATAGQLSFTLPNSGDPVIFIGGVIQRDTVDYTVDDLTVNFSTALELNDNVTGFVFQRGNNNDAVVSYSVEHFSGDGTTTTFFSDYSLVSNSSLIISIGGRLQDPLLCYTVNPTTDMITFVNPPDNGTDNIQVLHIGTKLTTNVPSDSSVDYSHLTLDTQTTINKKNYVINGNFDIWQRGTSQTISGFHSADRFSFITLDGSGDVTTTRENFSIGQTDVPGNPKYFARHTSTADHTYHDTRHKVENGYSTLTDKTLTVSAWIRSSTTITSGLNLFMIMITDQGQLPSGVNVPITLTANAWTKITRTYTIASNPSYTGNTTDYHAFVLRNATNVIGQTFDIAQVQIEEGTEATEFEQISPAEELALCQRYYEKSYNINDTPGTITNEGAVRKIKSNVLSTHTNLLSDFKTTKRIVPTVVVYNPVTGSSNSVRNESLSTDITPSVSAGESKVIINSTTQVGASELLSAHWTADAEL